MNARQSRGKIPIVGLVILAACWLATAPGLAFSPRDRSETLSRAAKDDVATSGTKWRSFGQRPMSFEANQGQAGDSTQFVARGQGYSVSLTREGAVVSLGRDRAPRRGGELEDIRPVERTVVRMTLLAANPVPAVAALEELPGKVNYFIGKDPTNWRTNVPTYGSVWLQPSKVHEITHEAGERSCRPLAARDFEPSALTI